MKSTARKWMRGAIENRSICTSHVERNNQTIRTFMKRFARMSLGFSKKLDNQAAATAVHVACFSFCRRMRENEGGRLRLTPAMQVGVTREVWDMDRLYRK